MTTVLESPVRRGTEPDLMDWLATGQLTLVGADRQPIGPQEWPELPHRVQANALEDFSRVVRGNAKAAVIFLRD